MKAILKGAYGTKNFGDDLLMIIAYRILKEKNYDVDVLAPNMSYLEKVLPGININSTNYKKDYDIMVFGGGTQFFYFDKPKESRSKGISNNIYKLIKLITSLRKVKGAVLRRLNPQVEIKRKAYIGVGLGPFDCEEIKINCLSKFDKNHYIAIRDERSLQYLNEFNIPAYIGADLCYSEFFHELIYRKVSGRKNCIGIILRDWNNSKEGVVSEISIENFISHHKIREIKTKFIFFSEIHDRQWINFCKKNAYDYIVWNPDSESITDFIEKINLCNKIISSRYHGLVIASLLKIPFVGLEIEPKISLFMNKFIGLSSVKSPYHTGDILDALNNSKWSKECDAIIEQESIKADSMVKSFFNYL